MNSSAQRHATIAITSLLLIGGLLLGAHWRVRQQRAASNTDSYWRVRYEVAFESERRGATVRVYVPHDTSHVRVFRQDVNSPHLEIDAGTNADDDARFVTVTAPRTGQFELNLRFDVRTTPATEITQRPSALATRADNPLAESDTIALSADQLRAVARAVAGAAGSKAQIAKRLFEFCVGTSGDYLGPTTTAARAALKDARTTHTGRRRLFTALCQSLGIPARRVTGFLTVEARHVRASAWVEVGIGASTLICDLDHSTWDARRSRYLPVCFGDDPLVVSRGMEETEYECSITDLPNAAELHRSGKTGSWARVFDLTQLPVEMRNVISVILLMPLGALVTCIFRNLIGIETSGRFTPMLVALSFVFADWVTGLLVLLTAVVLGLTARTVVEPLKLLVLPRLSIILTLIVWCLVFSISALAHYNFTPGPHAVLLPMVIMTMIVERFYISSQEDGMPVALRRLAGTIVVGALCYMMLRWESVARLLLVYPEAHVLTLAAFVAIGRYTGYRLSELWRFRDLAHTSG